MAALAIPAQREAEQVLQVLQEAQVDQGDLEGQEDQVELANWALTVAVALMAVQQVVHQALLGAC